MSAVFDAADVQGNIVRGYRKICVRYLILEVADRFWRRSEPRTHRSRRFRPNSSKG